ncbi:MAG: hypothetical protein MO852_15610, partial [Candidatus Devosia euplotis]|nr:hypothetical protein [Candidatus Devosia euplotis]
CGAMMQSVDRCIRAFDTATDRCTGEWPLPPRFTVDQLRVAFGLAANDPLFECYRITEQIAAGLGLDTEFQFEFGSHEYFLEADAVELEDKDSASEDQST